jgi:HEAT repeat protein
MHPRKGLSRLRVLQGEACDPAKELNGCRIGGGELDEEVERLRTELGDPEPSVRANALNRTIAVPSLSEPLLPLVGDADVEVRRKATWALGRLALGKKGAGGSLEALIRALDDVDEEVRENSAWALGELAGVGIGTSDAIPQLNLLLSDDSRQVMGMATWALGRLAERLGLCDLSSIVPLQGLAKDPSVYISKGADWALQRIYECKPEWAEGL